MLSGKRKNKNMLYGHNYYYVQNKKQYLWTYIQNQVVSLYWTAVDWGRMGWSGAPDCRNSISYLLGISNPKEEITLPAIKYLKHLLSPWLRERMLIEKKIKWLQSENNEVREGATVLTG